MVYMRRREFITLLGGAAALAARGARAAAGDAGDRISPEHVGGRLTHLVTAFRQGLSEAGFVEGQNVAIEYRWGDDQRDRLPGLVADLLRRRVAVIVANGVAAQAAKAATATTPIVFMTGAIRSSSVWSRASAGPAAISRGWSLPPLI